MGVWGINDGHTGWSVLAREVVPRLSMIEGSLGALAGGVQVGTNSAQRKQSCTKISDNVLPKDMFGQRPRVCFGVVPKLSKFLRPVASKA